MTLRLEVPRKCVQRGGVAAIDQDMRARARQGQRHGLTQMAAASGNKGGFAVQTEHISRHQTCQKPARNSPGTLPALGKQVFDDSNRLLLQRNICRLDRLIGNSASPQ
jgi:hypothetical protein